MCVLQRLNVLSISPLQCINSLKNKERNIKDQVAKMEGFANAIRAEDFNQFDFFINEFQKTNFLSCIGFNRA